jgi:hypothetical protein
MDQSLRRFFEKLPDIIVDGGSFMPLAGFHQGQLFAMRVDKIDCSQLFSMNHFSAAEAKERKIKICGGKMERAKGFEPSTLTLAT